MYVRVRGEWLLPREPRMDAALVIDRNGELWVREMRRVRAGELVAIGRRKTAAKASSCIRRSPLADDGEFKFMASEVSREKPVDYAHLASLLLDERERGGYIVWVTGPALVHSRARADMTWFIMNGFVSALLAGNAVAVHDIEASIFGTTLGMSGSGETTVGGHGLHMRAINKVRAAGSIPRAVEAGVITDGIMHACVRKGVPFVLCGSIWSAPRRVYRYAGRAGRHEGARRARQWRSSSRRRCTPTGNMLPVRHRARTLRELPTICVDSAEFVVG